MVRVEDASVAELDDLFDAAIGRSVQVPLVLAKLDKEAIVDIAFHLLSIEEMVIDSISFAGFR